MALTLTLAVFANFHRALAARETPPGANIYREIYFAIEADSYKMGPENFYEFGGTWQLEQ